MEIILNGVLTDVSEETTEELRKNRFPDADTVIVDGVPADGDIGLEEYCIVYICRMGCSLSEAIGRRDPEGLLPVLRKATVGIAGAGGLGSNIAVMLARSGVGRIVIADYDRIEPSNLNRQAYSLIHLGLFKVDAISDIISQIDPGIEVIAHSKRIDSGNVSDIFSGCDVICEAMDSAGEKRKFIESVSAQLPGVPLVSGNGMAGMGDISAMATRRLSDTLYMCGDGESDASVEGIMAPRVTVCAGMMANCVLRILSENN